MWSYVVWKNIWIFQEKRGYINYKHTDGVPPNSLTGLLPLYISRLKPWNVEFQSLDQPFGNLSTQGPTSSR